MQTVGTDKEKTRPSPTASATLYKVGTKKTGNDKNTWIIVENKNGVKRWKLFRVKTNTKSKSKSKSRSKSKSKSKDSLYITDMIFL